tara:strand:+ start:5100 stop:5810 length:711 start_codon:yes stop_codon:yes gene_type:complete
MTEELPEGLVVEDRRKFFLAIKATLSPIATLTLVKTEDEYNEKYFASSIYKFQIIDIDLGGDERLGYVFAAKVAQNREERGRKLSPIILVSAYSDELERVQNNSLISRYFKYYLYKNSPTFSEDLRSAVNDILTKDDDGTCKELENTLKSAINEYHIKNKIPYEDAEKYIMDTPIPETSIDLDTFQVFTEGFKKGMTVREALEECKNEPDSDRREYLRKKIIERIRSIEKEGLGQK